MKEKRTRRPKGAQLPRMTTTATIRNNNNNNNNNSATLTQRAHPLAEDSLAWRLLTIPDIESYREEHKLVSIRNVKNGLDISKHDWRILVF